MLGAFVNLFQIPGKIYFLLPPAVQIFIFGCFGVIVLICIFKMLL